MKINKILTTIAVVAPIAATIPATTSCNKMSADASEAQEYIKNRSFGLRAVSDTWIFFGTAWIISDATNDVDDDFQYWVATNWHVSYDMEKISPNSYEYHFDGQEAGTYTKFATGNLEWVSDVSEYCFEGSNTKKAIDLHIAKVNFGDEQSIPQPALTKLKAVNTYKKEHGYINKFVQTTALHNYCGNKLYCGGYPVPKDATTQYWKFETVAENKTKYSLKETKFFGEDNPAGHAVDNTDITKANILDISPNYIHTELFKSEYDETKQQYIPLNWSLIGGASGSMIVTKENNEFVVVGIFWGGFELADTEGNHYFSPSWSIFKSEKNFFEKYE